MEKNLEKIPSLFRDKNSEKNLVFFGNQIYHQISINSINHYLSVLPQSNIYYFTFDFSPVISDERIHIIDMKSSLPGVFYNMKPIVLQMAIRFLPHFIFVDSDTLPSKNLDYDYLISSVYKYPKANYLHSWQFPNYWFIDDKNQRIEYDHLELMGKLGVEKITQVYLQGCIYGVNKSCEKFINEWVEIITDQKFRHEPRRFFPLGDETVYNVLLWKYGVNGYFYNQIVFEPNNSIEYSSVEFGNIFQEIVGDTYCSNSKRIQIYHQIKNVQLQNEIYDIFAYKNNKLERGLSYLDFFEFLPETEEDRINFNFKRTNEDKVKIIARDVKTGLSRDEFTSKCERLKGSSYWWTPDPGILKKLGSIDLEFYLNGEFSGSTRIHYSGGEEILIKNKKFYLDYLKGNQYPTFWEVFIKKNYEIHPDFFIDKGDVVLDIGANYGFFTLYSISKGASKVYSVEPSISPLNHIKELSKNFSEIIPINKAVTDIDGQVSMIICEDHSAISRISSHEDLFINTYTGPSEKTVVNSVNINTLLSSIPDRIDFLKIDCEGSEFEIFKSISSKNLSDIKKIVIETHSEMISIYIQEILVQNNFKIYKNNNILFGINQ